MAIGRGLMFIDNPGQVRASGDADPPGARRMGVVAVATTLSEFEPEGTTLDEFPPPRPAETRTSNWCSATERQLLQLQIDNANLITERELAAAADRPGPRKIALQAKIELLGQNQAAATCSCSGCPR